MSLLLTLLACLGTSPDPGEDSASTEPSAPQALLGTGEWEWEALSDGDEIYVIQGPQGGWHLLGSVRTVGLVPGDPTSLGDPENPTTTFQVWVDGAPLVPNAMYVQGLDSILGGVPPYTHEMIGRFAILDITGDDVLDGVEVEFGVTVVDVDGVAVEDRLTLTAVPHPLNN